jgi:hypothetical protein
VIDAELSRAAQDRDGLIAVSRRAEYSRAGQLHRPEADAGHGCRSQNATLPVVLGGCWVHAARVEPGQVNAHRQDLVTAALTRDAP